MKQISIFLAFIFFATACSDSPTNPTNQMLASDYMPMAIGNYWIYEYTQLDANNKPFGDISIDSTVIVGKIEKFNKTFYTFVTYRSKQAIDTAYWSADNLTISTIANARNTGTPKLDNTVFQMLKIGVSDWRIDVLKIDSMTITFKGKLLPVWVQSIYHGYRNVGDDTIHIKNKEYIALSTKVIWDSRYETLHSSNPQVLLHRQPTYIYYAKNLGRILIKKETHSWFDSKDNILTILFPGWRRQLLRSHIK